jgi:hypothetical protein
MQAAATDVEGGRAGGSGSLASVANSNASRPRTPKRPTVLGRKGPAPQIWVPKPQPSSPRIGASKGLEAGQAQEVAAGAGGVLVSQQGPDHHMEPEAGKPIDSLAGPDLDMV